MDEPPNTKIHSDKPEFYSTPREYSSGLCMGADEAVEVPLACNPALRSLRRFVFIPLLGIHGIDSVKENKDNQWSYEHW